MSKNLPPFLSNDDFLNKAIENPSQVDVGTLSFVQDDMVEIQSFGSVVGTLTRLIPPLWCPGYTGANSFGDLGRGLVVYFPFWERNNGITSPVGGFRSFQPTPFLNANTDYSYSELGPGLHCYFTNLQPFVLAGYEADDPRLTFDDFTLSFWFRADNDLVGTCGFSPTIHAIICGTEFDLTQDGQYWYYVSECTTSQFNLSIACNGNGTFNMYYQCGQLGANEEHPEWCATVATFEALNQVPYNGGTYTLTLATGTDNSACFGGGCSGTSFNVQLSWDSDCVCPDNRMFNSSTNSSYPFTTFGDAGVPVLFEGQNGYNSGCDWAEGVLADPVDYGNGTFYATFNVNTGTMTIHVDDDTYGSGDATFDGTTVCSGQMTMTKTSSSGSVPWENSFIFDVTTIGSYDQEYPIFLDPTGDETNQIFIKVENSYPRFTPSIKIASGTEVNQVIAGTIGKWFNVIWTRNNAECKIYVQGRLEYQGDSGVGDICFQQLRIGCADALANYPFFGDVSNLMLWNRALSAGEVAAIWDDPFSLLTYPDMWNDFNVFDVVNLQGFEDAEFGTLNIASFASGTGTSNGTSTASAVSTVDSVLTDGEAETGYGINVDLNILWQTGGELTVDKSFYWNVGQQDLSWYRVEGCCRSSGSSDPNAASGCDIIGFQTDDEVCEGGKQQFVQNIVAEGLAELCQIIQNSRLRWQICSIKKFSRPADGRLVSPTDDCNELVEVPFCDLPECIEFCLQSDPVIKMEMTVTTTLVSIYYGDGTVITDGSAETDTDGDHGLSLFTYEPDGGEVVISGEAETGNSWENDTLVECVMDISVEGEEAIFGNDPNTNTLSNLTFTVSTDCGSCDAMPLILNVGHNLSGSAILNQFLKRNGLTMPESIPMHYSRRLQSWLGNYHFVGIGNDNANTQETWRFTFEWSCVSQINGINTGLNYWKFSILAVRNNGVTDFETRVILIFPPDQICDEDQNFAFDFSFNVNTLTHFVNTDLDFSLSDVLITDNIGLFKSQTWIKNPYLRIKLSRDAVTPLSQYQDIYPIFPQAVFGPSR